MQACDLNGIIAMVIHHSNLSDPSFQETQTQGPFIYFLKNKAGKPRKIHPENAWHPFGLPFRGVAAPFDPEMKTATCWMPL